MVDDYKDKYIKYKNKYLMLKNKLEGSGNGYKNENGDRDGDGDNNIYHIECTSLKRNENIFLNLLLQLLIEYECMFDINKNNLQNIKSVNTFASINPFTSTNIFGIEPDVNNVDNNINKNFLSIMNFLDYKSQSMKTLLNTKEQIIDTIKIIRDYCDNDIKCRIDMYKKELETNIFDTECNKMISDNTIKSFYDSRNYSISLMLNTLLGKYDKWKQPPIMVYKIGKDGIVEGHIFILYHYENGCLEAISIQTSLKLLVLNVCKNVKTGISIKLFNYIMETILPIFKSANYIYAFAWKIMSNILVKKFNFSTFTNENFRGYFINDVHIDINKINVNSFEYNLVRDLKDKATNSNSIYTFTVKKICNV